MRSLVTTSIDPATGAEEQRQTRFTRVALSSEGYDDAITVGIIRADDADLDVLQFSDRLDGLLASDELPLAEGYEAFVTADFATGVRSQLSSLTTNLLTGLAAVAVVSLILIGWRVALLTAGFMGLVTIGSLAGLWGIGFSLNTITLFGLILTLGLIVDDAIVISESIDANKGESDEPVGVIRAAIDRVGSASFAGTLTTVVVFSPMLFVGGILGEFIRPIPTTVIITLLLSFLFSIVFIPAIARRFLVNQRPVRNPVARIERRLAVRAGRLAAYPSGNGPKGWAVGGGLAAFAIVMVMVGGSIAGTLGFSIFPAGKDAVAIAVNSEFPAGTTIEEAEEIADEIDAVVLDVLGDDLERSQYLRGNERLTETFVDLSPIGDRPTAPQFVEQIEAGVAGIQGARITVAAAENGPPVLEFPFAAQIAVDDSTAEAGQALAVEIRDDLLGLELQVGGDTVTVLDAIVSTDGVIARTDGERFIEVRAQYDSDEVTGNLNATQDYLEDRLPAERTRGQRARPRCARLRLRPRVRQPGRLRLARRGRPRRAAAHAGGDHGAVPFAGAVAADLPGDPVQLPRGVQHPVCYRQPAELPGDRRLHRPDRRGGQQHDPARRRRQPGPTCRQDGGRGDPGGDHPAVPSADRHHADDGGRAAAAGAQRSVLGVARLHADRRARQLDVLRPVGVPGVLPRSRGDPDTGSQPRPSADGQARDRLTAPAMSEHTRFAGFAHRGPLGRPRY